MAERNAEFIDGFTSLEAGINSGLVPSLLPRNQAAFATNATFRGGYPRNRPGQRRIALDFGGDAALEAAFTQALYQGAAFYRATLGSNSLIAAIGGKLFRVSPDPTGSAVVTDISIPGDPNSATAPISWLWQSERWMIINDGINLPIFYNGVSSRRSLGNATQTAAVTDSNFNIPAVDATVEVEITEPWSQGTGGQVDIAGDTYTVESFRTAGGGAYELGTTQTWGAAAAFPDGTVLKVPSGFLAFVTTEVPAFTWVQGATKDVVLSHEFTEPIGTQMRLRGTIFGGSLSVTMTVEVTAVAGTTTTLELVSSSVSNVTIPEGALLSPPAYTWTDIATAQAFAAPGAGNNVDIQIDAEYTGDVPGYIYSPDGLSEFQVNSAGVDPVSTHFVTLRNVDGTEGVARNAPQDIDIVVNELPVGRMGAYGMGRNWMSLADGRSFIGSDLVGSSSGTIGYNYRDAVLKVTENTYLSGGGTFYVPGNSGNITAMIFTATLDTSLGQGALQVGTPNSIFSCNAPVDRAVWQDLENPILTESLKGKGPQGQYSTILANSDVIFRSTDGIGSLILARREFDVWGNTPISREVERVIQGDNEALLQNSTAIEFDNRILMACLPTEGELGIYHRGMVALNTDPVSSLRGKGPSIYDGFWTGLNVFQMVTGIFDSEPRAFAFCFSEFDGKIELWELLKTADDDNFDHADQPITWSFESAMLFQETRGKGTFDLCELRDGEVFLSEMEGTVYVRAWYRPEYSECWVLWHEFGVCAAEGVKQFRSAVGLGVPRADTCEPTNNRPTNIARAFQVRFEITGACKFMGARFRAQASPETRFALMQCDTLCAINSTPPCEPCRETGTCLQFPLVFYSLNAHKRYESGDVEYILPYGAEDASGYPPLFLTCGDQQIVKEVEDSATQAEIDTVVAAMIAECE